MNAETAARHNRVNNVISEAIEHIKSTSEKHTRIAKQILDDFESFKVKREERERLYEERHTLLWVDRDLTPEEEKRLDQIDSRLNELFEDSDTE